MARITYDQITLWLQQSQNGEKDAEERLAQAVYDELHLIARNAMSRERSGHTLQPTVLVHDAFVRLVSDRAIDWQNRNHFFTLAARTMRRILIDHARAANAEKRPPRQGRVDLDGVILLTQARKVELIALDDALNRLSAIDPRQEQIVELRYFGGLSVEETAGVLGISARTVKREWSMARAFLFGEISGEGELPPDSN